MKKTEGQVIKRYERILASECDIEIFFNSVVKPGKPNDELISAVKNYRKLLSE